MVKPDDDDLQAIERSRAPLIAHLVELRQRLIRSLVAIAVLFVVCFFFSADIYNILLQPYRIAVGPEELSRLISTEPHGIFKVRMILALFGAVFFAFPVIAIQIYKFVAPGLYRHERQVFTPYLIATPILFLLGAILAHFLILPLAFSFFLSMEQAGSPDQAQIEVLPDIKEYFFFVMALILAFGLSFQLPVLLTLLARVGIITVADLRRWRKFAIVGFFAVAAVLTPPDFISQVALAVPTLALYELSILAVQRAERNAKDARDQQDQEEKNQAPAE